MIFIYNNLELSFSTECIAFSVCNDNLKCNKMKYIWGTAFYECGWVCDGAGVQIECVTSQQNQINSLINTVRKPLHRGAHSFDRYHISVTSTLSSPTCNTIIWFRDLMYVIFLTCEFGLCSKNVRVQTSVVSNHKQHCSNTIISINLFC